MRCQARVKEGQGIHEGILAISEHPIAIPDGGHRSESVTAVLRGPSRSYRRYTDALKQPGFSD